MIDNVLGPIQGYLIMRETMIHNVLDSIGVKWKRAVKPILCLVNKRITKT